MATKKVKGAGRFKERYGIKIRTRVNKIEQTSRVKHECPKCTKITLKRQAAGIWVCRNCDVKVAGGAYKPNTPAGKIIHQIRIGKFANLKAAALAETAKKEAEAQTA